MKKRRFFSLGFIAFIVVNLLCSNVVYATNTEGVSNSIESVMEDNGFGEDVHIETENVIENNESISDEIYFEEESMILQEDWNCMEEDAVTSEVEETAIEENYTEEEQEVVMPTEEIWTSENFQIRHSVINYWDNGYQAEITVSNIGDNLIEDWNLLFEMNAEIYQMWNASIRTHEDNLYIIQNSSWNADIAPAQSVSFGYVASYEEQVVLPEAYGISGSEKEVSSDNYEILYEVTDMWEDGYIGNITITNTSLSDLRNWKISFELKDAICDIWNGIIHSNENGQYVIHCQEYNSVISAGDTVTIGFRVQGDDMQMYPENYTVKSIVHSTMRSDLRDDVIGVAYYEDLKVEDYRIADDGIQYVANQINLVGEEGVTFDQIAELGEEYEFEIVGYIELTNDYQIKFLADNTYEELNAIAEELESKDIILESNLNLVSTTESDYIVDNMVLPNDTEWCDDWDGVIGGQNKGVEAINAINAWQYQGYMTPVKIGVFDNMFDKYHDDLSFEKVWNNCTTLNPNWNDHGTHVAGTIAAEHNNSYGISGVAIEKELYAYAYVPNKDSISGQMKTTTMEYKYALALLIGNGTRVINISCNTGRLEAYAASHLNQNAKRYIQQNAEVLDNFLQRLIERGYDFVIVLSAGNVNNLYFKPAEHEYGYIQTDAFDSERESGGADARFNHFLACAERTQDRIIVVGSYQMNGTGLYKYAESSCIGERVDIMAMGVDIYSTMGGDSFGYLSGTSMAAPHVSGIAALAYSVNPELSGVQVKEFIVDEHGTINASDERGNVHYSADAEKVVIKALAENGEGDILGENTGFIQGYIEDAEKKEPIKEISIIAYKYSVFDGNVGTGEIDDYQYVTYTDINGEFSLELNPGMYKIVIYGERYKPVIIDNYEVLPSQVKYIEKVLCIDKENEEMGVFKGKVVNAINGYRIEDVDITIREGWNDYKGEVVCTINSDEIGEFEKELLVGYYTVELSKEGYIKSYMNIIVFAEVTSYTAVLSPELEEGEVRVVLSWGESPSDLDSHLICTDSNGDVQHLAYFNRTIYDSGNDKYYTLDVDDTYQYGPETVTFYWNNSMFEEYEYYIYNYSGGITGDELSFSGAYITIYSSGNDAITLNVPINEMGRRWNVFSIVDGQILIENTITN